MYDDPTQKADKGDKQEPGLYDEPASRAGGKAKQNPVYQADGKEDAGGYLDVSADGNTM